MWTENNIHAVEIYSCRCVILHLATRDTVDLLITRLSSQNVMSCTETTVG